MQFPFSFWGANYSPISPTSATCVAWWDPTNNASITLSSGKASQWNDLTGNGNNLIQATSTKQFTPTAAAINGKQAMLCNQSLNNMHGSGALSTGQLTSFSMWAVVYASSLAQYNGIIGSDGVTGNMFLEIGGGANQLDVWIAGVGAVGSTGSATITTSTLYWVAMTYSSGTLTVYINNVQKGTGTPSSRTLGNNYGVGGDPLNSNNFNGWSGYLGDCAIYNGVLSTADLTNLYNKFIVPKWG
jgi:hypothetical protein